MAPNDKTTYLLALIPILACLFLVTTSALFAANPASAEAMGAETCQGCHEGVVADFGHSVHGKKGTGTMSLPDCETCHGPGSEHVEGDGDPARIFSFSNATNAKKNEVCLGCHERGAKVHFSGSIHDVRGVACSDCHQIHASRPNPSLLKKENEIELCLSCHPRMRSALMKSSHHPMREGKVTCTDCHNPHGTLTENLLVQDSIDEVCYQCHAEKRGPFLWEHIPVRESCVNCHNPHGSNHQRLLKSRVPYLCQRCHSDPRHPGTLYDQSNVSTRTIYNRGCLNCHAAIHGSNHPSGRTFLR